MRSAGTCAICGKSIQRGEVIKCTICGAMMHKDCIDEEILTDAIGDYLCPYCAAVSALDWLDSILIQFSNSLNEKQREEISSRLKSYLDILEKSQ